jgi:photosystem II stability/assembly factor-like uncharacterized protein
MKYLILTFSFFLAVGASAANFTKVDLGTTATINKIYFDTDMIGWAATSDGQLFYTTDGGKRWKSMKVTSRAISDIQVTGRRGFLTGERGLLMKSTNGGATWQDISLNIKYNFSAIGMPNDSAVLLCGADQNSISKVHGILFGSWDYGKTFEKQPHMANGYVDLAVCPPHKVYLLGIRKVLHSISDGERYFHGGYEVDRMAFGFDFIDDWGFMVGSKGYFAQSSDHGRTWREVNIGTTKDLYAVEMFDKFSGVVVGDGGLVIYFNDDGALHTTEQCGYDANLRTVCVTGDKVVIGGTNGLLMYKTR